MSKDTEFALEFSEKTMAMVDKLAQKTDRTQDQVIEYILQEYLMRQLRVIEKRSVETGTPVNELLNMQFERLLEFMISRAEGNYGYN